jgi:Rrf2 family nitric oxide-sensitive transcriptional repressor
MQMTRYTDYSFRVLLYLSFNKDRIVTISEISEFYHISRHHLVKVVHNLSCKSYIKSSRGKGGGLMLARPPELINVGVVVRDTEPNFNLAECFQDETCDCQVKSNCGLKSIFSKAADRFMETLNEYTLADIMLDNILMENIIHIEPSLKSKSMKSYELTSVS